MIKDIIHNRLPLDAWEGVRAFNLAKKKRKVESNVDGESSMIRKGKKIMEPDSSGEEIAKVQNKKQKIVLEDVEDDKAEKKILIDILKMMETLNESISDMDKNLSSMINAMEITFGSRINVVETELKKMKESTPAFVPAVGTKSNKNEDDEACSKSSSWRV